MGSLRGTAVPGPFPGTRSRPVPIQPVEASSQLVRVRGTRGTEVMSRADQFLPGTSATLNVSSLNRASGVTSRDRGIRGTEVMSRADQFLPGTSATLNVSPLNRASGVTSRDTASPLPRFDAHFHPDRLESKSDGSRQGNPRIPVKLVGGILNFCDPITFSKPSFNAVLEEDRSSSWKIAVGIHLKHASRYSEQDWQAMLRHLTHSRVVGISEVGLDFSVPFRLWDRQELLFERILDLGTMGHVLVMHL